MRKKSIIPVLMALSVLVSISAKAQSSGPYAFVDGLFRYSTTSTRDGQNNIVSQDASTMGASIGVGYLASPNNDGQGVSIGVDFEIATQNNSYTNITGMPDTKEKRHADSQHRITGKIRIDLKCIAEDSEYEP